MRLIEHIIEPPRLLLSWQAQKSKGRKRYIVGELTRDEDNNVMFKYYEEDPCAKDALKHGFTGHPAFRQNGKVHDNMVLEAFICRLPPRSRRDFYRYLENKGINPDVEISDFALLGYTGAKLPDDGFELVHPFDHVQGDFEFISEVAGFRYESAVALEDIKLGDKVQFVAEPDNQHDEFARRIELNGAKLGYVDRARSAILHHYLDHGYDISGEIVKINGTSDRPLVHVYTSVKTGLRG